MLKEKWLNIEHRTPNGCRIQRQARHLGTLSAAVMAGASTGQRERIHGTRRARVARARRTSLVEFAFELGLGKEALSPVAGNVDATTFPVPATRRVAGVFPRTG